MKHVVAWIACALLAGTLMPASAQRQDRTPFRALDGYDEARFGSETLTVTSRGVARKVRVSFERLRFAVPVKPVAVKLPGAGLALLQHGAGDAKITASAGQTFEPLPSEWLRLRLPQELRIVIADDTVVLDVILVLDDGS